MFENENWAFKHEAQIANKGWSDFTVKFYSLVSKQTQLLIFGIVKFQN